MQNSLTAIAGLLTPVTSAQAAETKVWDPSI
jgi:hypothetical protein